MKNNSISRHPVSAFAGRDRPTWSFPSSNPAFAHRTNQKISVRLEYRFLSLVRTGGANVVNRLCATSCFLTTIRQRFGFGKRIQLIALKLAFPLFDISQILLKLSYAAGERILILETGRGHSADDHKLFMHLGYSSRNLVKISKIMCRFRKV